jgi:NAD+ kinase
MRLSGRGNFATEKRPPFHILPLMRFLILGNGEKPHVAQWAGQVAAAVVATGGTVAAMDLSRKEDLSRFEADIALVLGGDGAILRASRQMGYRQIPVLGINLGRLGFLADLSPEEACDYLPKVVAREYRLTQHLMFVCTVKKATGDTEILGLNEIVVRSGPPFKMLDLELAVNDETVSRFLGDGFIISTPVGSTAHSLAAGGPVLGQELSAFVITPICGHTLTNRPLVDSSEKMYTIRVRQAEGAWLVVDGQAAGPLQPGDSVVVRKADVSFQLVKMPGKTYYQTLREKLRWGTTPNYRNEPDPSA